MELNLSTFREQEALLMMVSIVKLIIMFGYISTGSGPCIFL